jgi:hypothetical protein
MQETFRFHCHRILYGQGHNSFAFSDLRHIIAKAVLSEDFDAVCCNYLKVPACRLSGRHYSVPSGTESIIKRA